MFDLFEKNCNNGKEKEQAELRFMDDLSSNAVSVRPNSTEDRANEQL